MGIVGTFKIEKDPFYQDGVKKGEAEKSHDVVENLITKLGLSDEQAADVAEVTIAFVKKVRKEIASRK